MLIYKIDVLKELHDMGYTSKRMYEERTFGQGDLQKMRYGIMVGTVVIDRLCELLGLQPGAILEYIPADVYERRKANDMLQPFQVIREKGSDRKKRKYT